MKGLHRTPSPDIHNVPFSDKKAFDRYVFCGHVTTNRLNEDHSYNAYVTPYYMDLDCGNGERNRGGSWRATVWMRTVQYMFDKFFKIRG